MNSVKKGAKMASASHTIVYLPGSGSSQVQGHE
jgi:hypothetical protein